MSKQNVKRRRKYQDGFGGKDIMNSSIGAVTDLASIFAMPTDDTYASVQKKKGAKIGGVAGGVIGGIATALTGGAAAPLIPGLISAGSSIGGGIGQTAGAGRDAATQGYAGWAQGGSPFGNVQFADGKPPKSKNDYSTYNTRDYVIDPSEMSYYERLASNCRGSGGCLEFVNNMMTRAIAPVDNKPSYWDVLESAGVGQTKDAWYYNKDYQRAKSVDAWDVHRVLRDAGGQAVFSSDQKSPANVEAMMEALYNANPGSILGYANPGSSAYTTAGEFDTPGMRAPNHAAIKMGLDTEGNVVIGDYGNIVKYNRKGERVYGHPIYGMDNLTAITTPKEYIGEVDMSQREFGYNPVSIVPKNRQGVKAAPDMERFEEALSLGKKDLMQRSGISGEKYDQLARAASAIAYAESEYGTGRMYGAEKWADNSSWFKKHFPKKAPTTHGMTQLPVPGVEDLKKAYDKTFKSDDKIQKQLEKTTNSPERVLELYAQYDANSNLRDDYRKKMEFREGIKQEYGINSPSDMYLPQKLAMATMSRLIENEEYIPGSFRKGAGKQEDFTDSKRVFKFKVPFTEFTRKSKGNDLDLTTAERAALFYHSPNLLRTGRANTADSRGYLNRIRTGLNMVEAVPQSYGSIEGPVQTLPQSPDVDAGVIDTLSVPGYMRENGDSRKAIEQLQDEFPGAFINQDGSFDGSFGEAEGGEVLVRPNGDTRIYDGPTHLAGGIGIDGRGNPITGSTTQRADDGDFEIVSNKLGFDSNNNPTIDYNAVKTSFAKIYKNISDRVGLDKGSIEKNTLNVLKKINTQTKTVKDQVYGSQHGQIPQ
jgi:hypothetical protein